MSSFVVDPKRKYEIKGEVCTMKFAAVTLTVAADQTVVAAVTGKRIRVMKWLAQSTNGTADSAYKFKSGTGMDITPYFTALGYTISAPDKVLNDDDTGWCETNTGDALLATVVTNGCILHVGYIEYTPGV
jgi:hypothetical protein